ncbi:MAG: glycoside hydrolase family 3 protein [Lachnospiraceae bacterium]|nr:glycoside hydrolase family 3 protein [Lachnospiraceae bacterium]
MILDWNEYRKTARCAAAEGVVLLKNDKNALPLNKGRKVAVFGRIQNNYYKSGTGSGGLVNVSRVVGIVDALLECEDIEINKELREIYTQWEEKNPFDKGVGWGNEPWAQVEMPVTKELADKAAKESDTAIIIIGRQAGEDKDHVDGPGSYRLTDAEKEMFGIVRAAFDKVVVILNVGNVIDMSFVDEYDPEAVLYVWQGGMIGGYGVADVLTGRVSPSGKLADTIAYNISDYPAYANFGDTVRNFYAEDIYVGYRYFETAAKDKVRYPFGFGLSYTTFEIRPVDFVRCEKSVKLSVEVKNTGAVKGKEVVQIYLNAPQGALGKPLKELVAFDKTEELMPQQTQMLTFEIGDAVLASYDDSGASGNKSCYVLEAGEYKLYAGSSVRDVVAAGEFALDETIVVERLSEVMAPVIPFKKMKPVCDGGEWKMDYEDVSLCTIDESERIAADIPEDIPYTVDKGIKLIDVKEGRASMNEFLGQLSDNDLNHIIRGEGMGSPKVTPGTAAAFGAMSPELAAFGIPCGCCADGPSGIRMDCGTKAFSLPNGTLLACTFNAELIEQLCTFTGMELAYNKVETLLGPGMNIHRHPLNGRNFEYFSEDPLLTGKMAAAQLRGFHKSNVTGTIKHFCGNNQETGRFTVDDAVSERALREIYLKGFEIAVKEGNARSIMTTYGAINGIWTASRYDLNTQVLRNEWGYTGIVMTDWWASMNERGTEPQRTNYAAMVRAQNDLYMVCPDALEGMGDNVMESLENGSLKRSQLTRSAANICRFLMNTHAFDRLNGIRADITIVNREEEKGSFDPSKIVYHKLDDYLEIPLDDIDTSKGALYVFGVHLSQFGVYEIELTAKSDLGELAQMPVTISRGGVPACMFTWNGTGGEWVSMRNKQLIAAKYEVISLYFGEGGLQLKDIKFKFTRGVKDLNDIREVLEGENKM